ncbi:uncharacterized protein LOC115948894 [Geospiza fortis]|uniref:Uncharacterized protein LOC115948894 n=1 Tax=Geospiza fortis TaxID=48883 RepID=A0A8N5HXI1_GEOFO|nr:uncharacterized protein LOC115948894 [Geospiza fortis]
MERDQPFGKPGEEEPRGARGSIPSSSTFSQTPKFNSTFCSREILGALSCFTNPIKPNNCRETQPQPGLPPSCPLRADQTPLNRNRISWDEMRKICRSHPPGSRSPAPGWSWRSFSLPVPLPLIPPQPTERPGSPSGSPEPSGARPPRECAAEWKGSRKRAPAAPLRSTGNLFQPPRESFPFISGQELSRAFRLSPDTALKAPGLSQMCCGAARGWGRLWESGVLPLLLPGAPALDGLRGWGHPALRDIRGWWLWAWFAAPRAFLSLLWAPLWPSRETGTGVSSEGSQSCSHKNNSAFPWDVVPSVDPSIHPWMQEWPGGWTNGHKLKLILTKAFPQEP